MDSFKRNQDEEDLRELRRCGVVKNIPQEYGVELPMISLAEVGAFAANLNINSLEKNPETGEMRDRRAEFVSKPLHINY